MQHILQFKQFYSVLLFIVLYILIFGDFGFIKSEITDYAVWCRNKNEQILNCPSGIKGVLDRYRYRVSVDRQDVISWNIDYDSSIQSHKNCTVKDRKNWKCPIEDSYRGSGVFGFSNGKYFITADEGYMIGYFEDETLHTSKEKWLFYKIKVAILSLTS